MTEQTSLDMRISVIADTYGRYRAEAYRFVLEALESALIGVGRRRNVTGGELLDGIRLLARERFGPMAKEVFNAWGVRTTLDFGQIVFHLVDANLLRKTPEDSLADFIDKFDFQKAFEENYFGDLG